MSLRFYQILVAFLTCVSISFIGTSIWLLVERTDDDALDLSYETENFVLKISRDGLLELENYKIGMPLVAHLGQHLNDNERKEAKTCNERDYCVEYESSKLTVDVRQNTGSEVDATCFDFSWTVKDNCSPLDCFENGKTFWYGGAEVYFQQWPLGSVIEHPYLMQIKGTRTENFERVS